jgi:RecA-family ATPase
VTFEEVALEVAKRGFHVFPLVPGEKVPAIKEWPDEASRDKDKIANWWKRNPEANVGICTNRFKDDKALVVIDVDKKHDKNGYEVLRELADSGNRLVSTLAVKTPSGGKHLYYSVDRGKNIRSGADVLGVGVDIRADGGFVVAPGSKVNGTKYEVELNEEISPVPPWVLNHGRPKRTTPRPRPMDRGDLEQDLLNSEHATRRGIEFLKDADLAQHGARDDLTLRLALALQDFGLSNGKILDLMFEHWNPRCPHPWESKNALMEKVQSAFRSRETAVGSRSGEAAFIDDEADKPLRMSPCIIEDLKHIPPRRWIINDLALGGKITLVIAPPGVGKSTFSLMAAMSVATGTNLLGDAHKVVEQGTTWMINNEDDTDEVHRRIAAQITHMRLDDKGQCALQTGFFHTSGTDRQYLIAKRNDHGVLVPRDLDATINLIKEKGVVLLIVDPLAETSRADENSNDEMLMICRMYRRIAQETQCAVIIIHHTRKLPSGASTGHVGNMDSGRGASSMTGVARLVLTLYNMDKKDAAKMEIDESEKHRYVRLDNAKSNMSLGCPTSWFVKESVTLPNTDSVGVMVPFKPPVKQTMAEQIRQVMDGESETPLGDVVRALQNEGVEHRGVSTQTLQRRVIKALEGDASLQVLESALRNGRVERIIADLL